MLCIGKPKYYYKNWIFFLLFLFYNLREHLHISASELTFPWRKRGETCLRGQDPFALTYSDLEDWGRSHTGGLILVQTNKSAWTPGGGKQTCWFSAAEHLNSSASTGTHHPEISVEGQGSSLRSDPLMGTLGCFFGGSKQDVNQEGALCHWIHPPPNTKPLWVIHSSIF